MTHIRIQEFRGDNPDLIDGLCLHPDDPEEMLEVMTPYMEARKRWLRETAGKGLRLAVALGPEGQKLGLMECVPIELAAEAVRGENSLFINCLWVLPAYWKKGVATALMNHFNLVPEGNPTGSRLPGGPGAGGVTVLCYEGDRWFGYFSYMPARFFKKFGFEEVDRDGSRVLLHLDLRGASRPSLLRPKTRPDACSSLGRHVVEVLYNSQCPWAGWMIHGIKRYLGQFDVELRFLNTDDRAVAEQYGMTRGVYMDGRPLIARLAPGREVARIVKRHLGDQ
ncbi:MAG TPA: GNAT family N-acetyltransferase [Firmicutes bacterium]|nr:GNAT family N-acetyltransferase [Candidatus Fermentithermobacillaceae bacterium]